MKQETQVMLDQVAKGMNVVAGMVRQDTNEVMATKDHVEIIKHFAATRNTVEQIKLARKALDEIEEQLSKQYIPDLFREMRETTGQKPPYKIEGVGSVTVSYKFSCSMPDKDAGHEWLRSNGHGGLITETVNSSSLSAFAKDMIENHGIDLPAEVFKTSSQPYTSIRKA